MSKVFVLSEYTSETQNSTGYYWSKIIKGIDESGIETIAIYPLEKGKKKNFEGSLINEKTFSAWNYKKKIIFFRAVWQGYLTLKFAIKALLLPGSGDIVFCGTNPIALLLILPLAKRLKKFKWIILVHDVYPDNLVAAGILKRKGLFFKFLSYIFSRAYSSADQLIVIGRDMKKVMKTKVMDHEKIVYISNWANAEELVPIPRKDVEILQGKGLEGKTVFQFFGNIGRVQGIENILSAIHLTKNESAAFIFIGGGVLISKVKDFIDSNPEKKILYIGSIPLERKNIGLSACDVALVTLEKGMLGLGVPSKSYFTMAANKPILAVMEEEAEISQVVRKHGIGWTCEPGKPRELALLFDSICEEGIDNIKVSPRRVLEENFSERIAMASIIKLIKRCCEQI